MARSPSRTVRIDMDSHAALCELSRRYQREWGACVTMADLVRMGISLLNRDIAERERFPEPPPTREGGDDGP